MSESLYKKVIIKSINEEVSGFKTFVFEEGHRIQYKAGQYITFVQQQAGAEVRRSYSITSSPFLGEPLSIGVKRVENGAFSRQLIDAAKVGDELLTIGSGGLFVLPDDIAAYKQLFFFAAGSGITPIYSLLKTALFGFPHLSIVLVYSNASVEKTVFHDSLKTLQQIFSDRFQLELLFSNAPDLSQARLHRDRILQLLKQRMEGDKEATLFYVCGPENYMRLCTYTLQEDGIDPSNIKRENFVINNLARRDATPPDKEDRTAHIQFGEGSYTIPVHFPDSILQAAKKAGLSLPYSCEAGRCGNCVARCKRGEVWHSYNEVLTEKELARGLVLTCVGHPVGGDVWLEI